MHYKSISYDSKNSKQRRQIMEHKKIVIISAVIVSIGIISGLVMLIGSGTPQIARNPELQTTESQLKYIASKEFGTLPNTEKSKYIKSLDRGELFKQSRQLPDEAKHQLRKNIGGVFRTMMKERIGKYSQLSTKAEKNAYLDKMIDKMSGFRKERKKTMSSADKKKQEERRAKRGKHKPSLDRIKNRIETSDPKERAQFMGFIVDMRARMKERGISSPHRRW